VEAASQCIEISEAEDTWLKIGDVYLSRTLAGVDVRLKVVGFYDEDPYGKDYVQACLVSPDDVKLLRDAGVPYEKEAQPHQCIGSLFTWQVIKKVRRKRKKRKRQTK